MNTQIKQLADQIWSLNTESDLHFQQCLQTFAELIVRECIVRAQSVDQLRGATEEMIHGADIAGLQIARHFEIKL